MRYVWFFILTLSVFTTFGQKSAKVRELENQRKKTLAEIEMTNQLLSETKQSAQNSLNRLNLLSKQILSRKKIISLLNQEINEIESQVNRMTKEIANLEKELGQKQGNYTKSVQSIQKRQSSQDKLLYILSADNFAQSLRRMRYLREYADWQKRQAVEIVEKQKEINRKKEELNKTRQEKNVLLGSREEESKVLQVEEAGQKKEVQDLGKKQKQLQADLKKKQQQANALNKRIEQQIAEEIARAEEEARLARERERIARENAAKKSGSSKKSTVMSEPIREERVAESKGGYAMTKEEKKLSDNFVNNRGRLPFPVTGRYSVVGTFGEQQHQELKYVRTNNSGIDIQASPGADARAVFNGEVTRVFVVPGYNNSVIIRHGNYLTVYSNLSQVYVKAGDKVETRQALGKVFTDTEDGNATILHFQLWKEKTKQNPQHWLD